LIYSHPRPLLMWRLSSSLSSSSTWVMYLNFNEEVTLCEKFGSLKERWNQPCQLLLTVRNQPVCHVFPMYVQACRSLGNCSDSRYAYSLASSFLKHDPWWQYLCSRTLTMVRVRFAASLM
jgi:hypothetical protein